MTIDREMLMAYADGELDALTAKRIEKAIAAQPELAEQVAAHRTLRATIADHYAPVMDQPLPDGLTTLLDPKVVPFRVPPVQLQSPLRAFHLAAMAAALVVGLMVGQMIDFGPEGPVASRKDILVAQGNLAKALDTQLASAQAADVEMRIGLTFHDQTGKICRTFEGPSLSGIACREGDAWQLRRIMSGVAQMAEYRQAGSAETMGAAQAMMAGDPLDAATEKAARNRGWK